MGKRGEVGTHATFSSQFQCMCLLVEHPRSIVMMSVLQMDSQQESKIELNFRWLNYFFLTTPKSDKELACNPLYSRVRIGPKILACEYPDQGIWSLDKQQGLPKILNLNIIT